MFWPPYFGKVLCPSITLRWEEPSIANDYIALLVRLKEEIAKEWQQMKKKNVLFHQENAPCHKWIATMAKLHELHFALLSYPPFSPDLAPINYWLFADLERILHGKRFGSNEEVISETEVYFETKEKSFNKKRHQIVREMLESVYDPRRRLCWWIKSNFS